MAKDKETIIIDEQVEAVNKAQDFLEKNKKNLTILGVAAAITLGGSFFFKSMSSQKEEAMSNDIWQAQAKLSANEFSEAANGAGEYYNLEALVEKHGTSSKSGNIAAFDLGISYLNSKEYQKAITYFEKASFNDVILNTLSVGAQGDAYVELDQLDKALSKYEDAIALSNNKFTAPLFLKKVALIYEKKGDANKAVAKYKQIVENYPTIDLVADAKKKIAKLTK